jgi:Phosphate transporter family
MSSFFRRFMPREQDFFVLFQKQAANVVAGATAFTKLLEHFTGVPEQVQIIKAFEHTGEEITHQIFRILAFEFSNGWHDAANSIATVVSTCVLAPLRAVVWAAFWNFIAAFVFGTAVASTVGKGLVHLEMVDTRVLLAGLVGAITWNLFTLTRCPPVLRMRSWGVMVERPWLSPAPRRSFSPAGSCRSCLLCSRR